MKKATISYSIPLTCRKYMYVQIHKIYMHLLLKNVWKNDYHNIFSSLLQGVN